jgi:hypothetical protein
MMKTLAHLFTIRTRFEAFAVIYAIAVGAVTRGTMYLQTHPGIAGYILFAACTAAVFIAGAKILDSTERKRREGEERRRCSDRRRTA